MFNTCFHHGCLPVADVKWGQRSSLGLTLLLQSLKHARPPFTDSSSMFVNDHIQLPTNPHVKERYTLIDRQTQQSLIHLCTPFTMSSFS